MGDLPGDKSSLAAFLRMVEADTWYDDTVDDTDEIDLAGLDERELLLYIDHSPTLTDADRARIARALEADPDLAEIVADLCTCAREDGGPVEAPTATVMPLDESPGGPPAGPARPDDFLRHALLVLNDVVAFGRHRLAWVDEIGRIVALWHYRIGAYDPARLAAEAGKWQPLIEPSARSGWQARSTDRRVEGEFWQVTPLPARGRLRPVLLLGRVKRAFEAAEARLVAVGTRLIAAALADDDHAARARATLERLMIAFLQDRRHLESANPREILQAHVEKAGLVIHPELFDPMVPPADAPAQTVRITAKEVNPSRTMLRFKAVCSADSRDPGEQAALTDREWYDPDTRFFRRRYHLIAPSEDDRDTIAERVFHEEVPYLTLDYQNEPRSLALFTDTACHISVPLAPGPTAATSCLGVLSIETTRPGAYSDIERDALTLLGARAAVPLGHAHVRNAERRRRHEEQEVARAVELLGQANTWEEILDELKVAFRGLHYVEGVLGRVDREAGRIVAAASWSYLDTPLDTISVPLSSVDAPHVRAVESGQPVYVEDPETDPAARTLGVPSPFGIFPLVGLHGDVNWTVSLVRRDGAPFGPHDMALVEKLCQAAVAAWERTTHRNLERLWFERVVATRFASMRKLLAAFADFVVDNGFATRCRVYLVKGDAQLGYRQAGLDPVEDFESYRPAPDGARPYLASLRRQFQPTLWIVDPDDHYAPGSPARAALPRRRGVLERDVAIHTTPFIQDEQRLRKEGLREWVEMPVGLKGELLAKVVLEHKGRKDDRFTPSELKLCASLTRDLNLALGQVRLNPGHARTPDDDMMERLLARIVTDYRASRPDARTPGEPSTRAVRLAEPARFERVVRLAAERLVNASDGGPPTLGDALQRVTSQLAPWFDDVVIQPPDSAGALEDLPIEEGLGFYIGLLREMTGALVRLQGRLRKEPGDRTTMTVRFRETPPAAIPAAGAAAAPPAYNFNFDEASRNFFIDVAGVPGV